MAINYFRLAMLIVTILGVFYYFSDDEPTQSKERRAAVMVKRDTQVGSITQPQSSTIWWLGQQVQVQWQLLQTPPVNYLNIDLYNNANQVKFFVRQLANNQDSKSTSLNVQIPATLPTGSNYVIRVWGPYAQQQPGNPAYWQVPDSEIFAISSWPLGIAAPVVNVVSGSQVVLTYYAYGNQDFSSDGATVTVFDPTSSNRQLKSGVIIASKLPLNSGANTFAWNVAGVLPPSQTYQLRIGALDSNGKTQFVDTTGPFTLVSSNTATGVTLQVSANTVVAGQQVTIGYTYTGPDSVPFDTWKIYLFCRDQSISYYLQPLTITEGEPSSSKSYSWEVPKLPASSQYFMVMYGYSHGDPTPYSASSQNFGVSSGQQLSSGLAITLPLASTSWTSGVLETVNWALQAQYIGQITGWDVDLFTQDNTNKLTFVSALTTGAAGNANTVSWTVPASLGSLTNTVVRVTGYFPDNNSTYASIVALSPQFKINGFVETTSTQTATATAPAPDNGSQQPKSSDGMTIVVGSWWMLVASVVLLM